MRIVKAIVCDEGTTCAVEVDCGETHFLLTFYRVEMCDGEYSRDLMTDSTPTQYRSWADQIWQDLPGEAECLIECAKWFKDAEYAAEDAFFKWDYRPQPFIGTGHQSIAERSGIRFGRLS